MKMLLIYPPQWNPTSIYLSVPLLVSQLRSAGYDADGIDLNVRFFNRILRSDFLLERVEECERKYKELAGLIFEKYPDAQEKFNSYSLGERTMFLKFKKMAEMFSSGAEALRRVALSTDEAVRILRSKDDFYVPEKLFGAKKTLIEALKIASLPYAPNEMIWDNYFSNPLMKLDWENIDFQCKDESTNMFIDFFNEFAEDKMLTEYDYIGISVPDLSQLIPAFTLARILKEKTGAKISIGGNYITQNKADFMKHPELFGEYVDFLSVGDGEIAVIELAQYLSGKRKSLKEVSNTVFKDENGETVFTYESKKLDFENISYLDLDDMDFSLYFSPEPVLPVQLSKGCYWGKCSFCDYYYGQQCFDIKKIEAVIDELKYYNEKYGIRRFAVIDEAIPPKYYKRLSEAIIESGLDITYYSFARLEDDFSADVLENMYRSGARILLWGYEAYSQRILEKMNKGISAVSRERILRDSHNAGMWNNVLFIIGYPTETEEEVNLTLDFVKNNRDIVNSTTPSNFSLKKNALLHDTVGKDGIISCETNGEFYTVLRDNIEGIPQHIRRDIRRDFHLEMITKYSKSIWPVNYSDFDLLLLYLSEYTCRYVAEYESEEDLTLMFR